MEDKFYYSIAEVSKEFDLPYSTLRYWEKEFKKLSPHKNKRGVRFYTKENVGLLRQIVYLTKEKHYTLEGAKQALKENKTQGNNYEQVISTLKEAKEFLLDLRNKLDLDER
ncbi:MAG: MerR family transcriptional regulator [Bacteroidota bacterium]|nr:MerR family transcriptional regulator [Bacteroidota bacterium]